MGGADGRGGRAWRALTSRSDTSAARRWSRMCQDGCCGCRVCARRCSPAGFRRRLLSAWPEGRGRAGREPWQPCGAPVRAGVGRRGTAGPGPARSGQRVSGCRRGVGLGRRARVGPGGPGARLVRLRWTPQGGPALWRARLGDPWLGPGGLRGGGVGMGGQSGRASWEDAGVSGRLRFRLCLAWRCRAVVSPRLRGVLRAALVSARARSRGVRRELRGQATGVSRRRSAPWFRAEAQGCGTRSLPRLGRRRCGRGRARVAAV